MKFVKTSSWEVEASEKENMKARRKIKIKKSKKDFEHFQRAIGFCCHEHTE